MAYSRPLYVGDDAINNARFAYCHIGTVVLHTKNADSTAFLHLIGPDKPQDPNMPTNDLMIVIISCGLGLTVIYLVNQMVHWAAIKAANRRALIEARRLYRKLHSATVGSGSKKVPRPSATTRFRG